MKFDLWTFLFQVLNFLVLLFILKRLLFRPVREIIEKRRRMIEETMQDAQRSRQEAQQLSRSLEEELQSRKTLRREVEDTMRQEVNEARKRLMEDARQEAGKIIEKERAVFEMEKTKFQEALGDRAADAVALYAQNILRDICDEELHLSILRKFQAELQSILTSIQPSMGGNTAPETPLAVTVSCAYPLDRDTAERLRKVFEERLAEPVTFSVETTPSLLAGIAVRAEDRIFDYSISGQIQRLRAGLHEGRQGK